jgi:protein-disulfide isomerase
VAVGVFVGIGVFLSKSSTPPAVTIQEDSITDSDHRKGNPEGTIELIEYGDMQCPACASVQPWVNQLMTNHGDKINFAFRHYPLKSIHRNAVRGGEAAEAAGVQGKFFEMTDLLMSRQSEWANLPDPGSKFDEFAQELGLNMEQYTSDYHSQSVSEKVESGYQTAISLGLNSTPSFFLNGQKINTPNSYQQFEMLISAASSAVNDLDGNAQN